MRTTLDIDDRLLAIARSRARERGVSLGTAVSELMQAGLTAPARLGPSGFMVFESPEGAPEVTDEIVARYRDGDPDDIH